MNAATLSSLPVTDSNQRMHLSPLPVALPLTERPNHAGPAEETGDDSPKKKSGNAQKRVFLVILALLAAASAARFGHHWWTVGRFIETTDDSYVGGDITGIAAKVPGFIANVAVVDNQQVHAGDLLIKIDDRDYAAALARAEAAVAIQQGAIGNLDANRHLQEAVVAQASAEIASVEAEISRSGEDRVRYQKLSQSAVISIQSFEKADADYKQAVAAGQKAQAALAAAERKLDVISAQRVEAEASLRQSNADLDIARLNLSYTVLRAPVDGIVGNRSARAGAYTSIGSQLISLVPTRGLWIDANFKESQLARIHPGSTALVKVDSLSGPPLRGRVTSVAPATGAQFSVLPPENATGNFTKIVQRVTVRIMLDNESATEGRLRPGLSVTAEVDGRSIGKGIL